MVPGWLEALSWAWLATGAFAAGWIVADEVRHPQQMAVMNVVWPVNALYLGPLGIWAYGRMGKLASREHVRKEGKDAPKRKPFWQTAAVADTHCGAGCTLGDIVAEWTVFFIGLRIAGDAIWPEIIFDFVAAYLLGIVFQYLTIAPMRGEHGWAGIKAALKADTASLVAFEVGLFAWMLLSRFVFFARNPLHPTQAPYWFMMQVGMLIGFLTAYPVNWWLVRAQLKEAM